MSTTLFEAKTFDYCNQKTETSKFINKLYLIPVLFIVLTFLSASLGFPKNLSKGLFYSIFFSLIIVTAYIDRKYKFHNVLFFDGLKINENELKIGAKIFQLKDILGLRFERIHYDGKRVGKITFTGLENKIYFNYQGEDYGYPFYLDSLTHYKLLINSLIFIVCNEKIPYQRSYLHYIPNEYRENSLLEEFIIKLIKERRIDCTEGLLIIGYKSDAEAKELRAKYCS